jgi:hypothetical protein
LTTKIRWVDPHPSDHVWVLAELQPIPVAPQPPATGNEDWTHGAFYGTRGTFFVDLTGDGRADAVAVNDDAVTVRRNTGHDFGPGSQANEDWTHGSCYGSRGTFFADLNAARRPDILVVNDDTITARRNTGSRLGL